MNTTRRKFLALLGGLPVVGGLVASAYRAHVGPITKARISPDQSTETAFRAYHLVCVSLATGDRRVVFHESAIRDGETVVARVLLA